MKDRRRIKKISGMEQIMYDLKPRRCDCDVFVNHKLDVTELMKYLEKSKKEGNHYTFFQALVTAIGKTFYNRPKLNRFVANRHLYEHTTVSISLVAKVEFEDNAEEIMIIVPIEPDDNIDTISKKMNDKVNGVRNKTDKKAGANSAIDILGKFPNIIRVPLIGTLKFLDKRGLLPASLVEDNLYYSSIILSNLGALHFGAIYHNNTDFGSCSAIATIGEVKDEEVIVDGKKQVRKLVELGANFDERIGDGFYFVKSLKLLENILKNPKCLENRADEVLEQPKVTKKDK